MQASTTGRECLTNGPAVDRTTYARRTTRATDAASAPSPTSAGGAGPPVAVTHAVRHGPDIAEQADLRWNAEGATRP